MVTTDSAITYAFIDSQNVNLGVHSSGWNLDFKKFYIYLRDRFKISKSFLFIGYMAGNESLYTNLQQIGYILIFKPTLTYRDNGKEKIKGNVDAELVLHTMIHFNEYNHAVIASGDGDFHCLIEYLESKEKLLKVCIPNKHKYSALLKKYRSKLLFISDLQGKLGINN